MAKPELFDHRSNPIRLGPQLGKGGEGTVYEVAGVPDLVAKVYHTPPNPRTSAKLQAMVALARPELTKVAAWPTALLHKGQGGDVAGLLMPKVRGFSEAHALYSPAHRKTAFPQADWRFLTVAAHNCAAAFANLHEAGVVVGDVNQSNVLISTTAEVVLIDCDSFQIQHGGEVYPCEVGVALFTPPELQGQALRGVARTSNHDRFGLAVMLFHLLFLGRHPFAGRYSGAGDMPLEKAIAEFRFAYGQSSHAYLMQPPLHSLPLVALPDAVGQLFDRAFGQDSTRPDARPTALEWGHALAGLAKELKPCPAQAGHVHARHLMECPWCALMRGGGPNFFISVVAQVAVNVGGQVFHLAAVWTRIEQVAAPKFQYQRLSFVSPTAPAPLPAGLSTKVPPAPVAPALLSARPKQPPSKIAEPTSQKITVPPGIVQRLTGWVILGALAYSLIVRCVWMLLALAALVVALILEARRQRRERDANAGYEADREAYRENVRLETEAWEQTVASAKEAARKQYQGEMRAWEQVVAPLRQEVERRREAHKEAKAQIKSGEKAAAAAATRVEGEFAHRKDALARLKKQYEQLAREYDAAGKELRKHARERQLEQFLQRHLISDDKIPGVGAVRESALASFGIETAWDVVRDAVLQVPGVGEKTADNLLGWRAQIEKRFQFNSSAGVPESDRRAYENEFAAKRQPVEQQLSLGEAQLRKIAAEGEAELRRRQEEVRAWLAKSAQAELDVTVIPKGV